MYNASSSTFAPRSPAAHPWLGTFIRVSHPIWMRRQKVGWLPAIRWVGRRVVTQMYIHVATSADISAGSAHGLGETWDFVPLPSPNTAAAATTNFARKHLRNVTSLTSSWSSPVLQFWVLSYTVKMTSIAAQIAFSAVLPGADTSKLRKLSSSLKVCFASKGKMNFRFIFCTEDIVASDWGYTNTSWAHTPHPNRWR